ncbi:MULTISPECIES: aldehyde dehydrogenase family protein [Streptomyces violaceusniger group]|uniref:Aldehyde dehydrogenase family protein n=2 Tax=Streptomyces javensis TaxID=114698 RepID=A0ABN1WRV3_9ACTN|nr:aldehyde dehydrogenase family protein [Streptomyces javensis]MBI0312225.1 aldehyde dehydrogenase family protein [Streptomyces javensis]
MTQSTTLRIANHLAGSAVGEPTVERRNPADPADLVAVTPASDAAAVAEAVTAAEGAQPGWAALPAPARGAILMDAAEILRGRHEAVARDLTREEGKTLAEARGEVRRAIDVLRYFGAAGWRLGGQTFPSATPDTAVHTRLEPMGVAGLITPWNFPIAIPAWKMAPALVSGNSVVIKPAELTPVSVRHLMTALAEAGLPPGVLNVVHGRGSVVGEALVADPRVAAVSFTGSTGVGNRIRETVERRHGRVQLEMGGKNAVVVLDDADVRQAAELAAAGGFGLTGQACTASSRIICTPGVHDAFVEALAEQAARYRPGDGLAAGTAMGPVVSAAQLETDVAAVERARAEGATVVAGGEAPDGLFLAPTVLAGVGPGHSSARDEIFGPVVAVLAAEGLDEAISLVNDSAYGLAASICTRDLAAAQHFVAGVQAGVVKVNRPTTGLDLNVPFGGVKDSSTNTFREQGPTAVEFFTWSKSVYLGW